MSVRAPLAWLACAAALWLSVPLRAETPLQIVVMDPLATPLSCACLPGRGQRNYARLAKALETRLQRPVRVVYEEGLALAYGRIGRKIDLVFGVCSVVEQDARTTKSSLRRLALLSGLDGGVTERGAFLVPTDSKVKRLADLAGKRVVLAPAEFEESHGAARRALTRAQVDCKLSTAKSLDEAVFAVADREADAAMCPDFLVPMLEACGKVAKGDLRVLDRTAPLPFVGLYVSDKLDDDAAKQLIEAVNGVLRDEELAREMETRDGLIVANQWWTQWRGVGRAGRAPSSLRLGDRPPTTRWTAQLTGPAMAGIAATHQYVVVPDKDADQEEDIFRCFDAATGKPRWKLRYEAPGRIEYTNSPRATPVIRDGLVYLQGAWGDLHCVELDSGRIVWRTNLLEQFQAEPLNWGCSSPPLLADGQLIVNPGAAQASLASLDPRTGQVKWKTAGHASAYSAFLVGRFGGRRQLVGYDAAGLGGWDLATGKRLWELVPPGRADFNVGTPLSLDGTLLVATENNATRRYKFDDNGRPLAKPAQVNDDFAPDTCTPVELNGRLYGTAYGELFCLDAKTLKTRWIQQDDMFYDHTNCVAAGERLLVWTTGGDLLLVADNADKYQLVWKLRPFDGKVETTSHPALTPGRIYVRSGKQLKCLDIQKLSP